MKAYLFKAINYPHCMEQEIKKQNINKPKQIHKNMQIAEAVALHPKVGEIFTGFGLHCVGCHVSPYETIEQGCLIHGMSMETIKKMVDTVNETIKLESVDTASSQLNNSTSNNLTIKLTEFAVKKLKELRDSKGYGEKGLRIAVLPGGCAGFSYDFSFDTKQDDDIVIEQDGFTLLVDEGSLEFVKGSTLDYVDSLQGAGLKISNPNAKSSCGCGNSFG